MTAQIVVCPLVFLALVSNEEVTLKRIEHKPRQVVLHPANVSVEAMVYLPEEGQVQGVSRGLFRGYHGYAFKLLTEDPQPFY